MQLWTRKGNAGGVNDIDEMKYEHKVKGKNSKDNENLIELSILHLFGSLGCNVDFVA